jgi:hypothetical protein
MDFTNRLTRQHLLDLIQYIKSSTLPLKIEGDEKEKTLQDYLQ